MKQMMMKMETNQQPDGSWGCKLEVRSDIRRVTAGLLMAEGKIDQTIFSTAASEASAVDTALLELRAHLFAQVTAGK